MSRPHHSVVRLKILCLANIQPYKFIVVSQFLEFLAHLVNLLGGHMLGIKLIAVHLGE